MSGWFTSYGFAPVWANLVIGAYPKDAEDVGQLLEIGVERILNLAEDEEYPEGAREEIEACLAQAGLTEERLRFVDFGPLPPVVLEAAVEVVSEWLDDELTVYVHCRAGWQRSAAVAAAVIAAREGIDVDDALDAVQIRKPTADPLPHQRQDLRQWWEERQRAGRSSEERQRAGRSSEERQRAGRSREEHPRADRAGPDLEPGIRPELEPRPDRTS